MRVLLIGEAPGKRAGKVLDYEVFAAIRGGRRNLFEDRSAIDDGKRVSWPAREARLRADAMVPVLSFRYDRIVFVGKRVARAFGFDRDYLEWKWFHERNLPPCVVFPHPSGLNRWWNDAKNRERAREFVEKELVR